MRALPLGLVAACTIACTEAATDDSDLSSSSDAESAPEAEALGSGFATEAEVFGKTVRLSLGSRHSCAIKADDSLWCWGSIEYGQLGLGDPSESAALQGIVKENSVAVPTQVGEAKWRSIAAGHGFSCGVQVDGSLWCWGDPSAGELGRVEASDAPLVWEPRLVGATGMGDSSAVVVKWKTVAAGRSFACAVREDNRVLCWGANDKGQAGQATASEGGVDVDVVDGPTLAVAGKATYLGTETGQLVLGWEPCVRCWRIQRDNEMLGSKRPDVAALHRILRSMAGIRWSWCCPWLPAGQVACWRIAFNT